jgi:hypothetical protein
VTSGSVAGAARSIRTRTGPSSGRATARHTIPQRQTVKIGFNPRFTTPPVGTAFQLYRNVMTPLAPKVCSAWVRERQDSRSGSQSPLKFTNKTGRAGHGISSD